MSKVDDLRRALLEAEAEEEAQHAETDRTRLLAHLADHRFDPTTLGRELDRIWSALELLGVDLDAEGGPVLKSATAADTDTAAEAEADTEPADPGAKSKAPEAKGATTKGGKS